MNWVKEIFPDFEQKLEEVIYSKRFSKKKTNYFILLILLLTAVLRIASIGTPAIDRMAQRLPADLAALACGSAANFAFENFGFRDEGFE